MTWLGRMGAVLLVTCACGLLPCVEAVAAGQPAPATLCTLRDDRLGELSGLATDDKHWYAVNDGGSRIEVFVLGEDCRVQDVITNPADPFDVEDLARAADGTLWLADTGDNQKRRDTVALHAVSPGGEATLYRLTYPDGQHDAEALLLDRSGTPYLITKNVLGKADVYRPAGKLASPGPTALEHAGSLRIQSTDTPGGPVGSVGSVLVTGAAASADGTVVALRTYTDAYLYSAPDGDVVAALQREPVRVALPGEPQGEAIAFTVDGSLLSASEGVGEQIRTVQGAAGLAAAARAEAPDAKPASGNGPAAAGQQGEAGVPTLPAIVIAVVVASALVFGISKLRNRR